MRNVQKQNKTKKKCCRELKKCFTMLYLKVTNAGKNVFILTLHSINSFFPLSISFCYCNNDYEVEITDEEEGLPEE